MVLQNCFMLISTELFTTPGLYALLLRANGAVIAPNIIQSLFPGDIHNAMVTTIALFYASQGITIPMAKDAAAYALEWIQSFHSSDVDTGIEIHAM